MAGTTLGGSHYAFYGASLTKVETVSPPLSIVSKKKLIRDRKEESPQGSALYINRDVLSQ